MVISRKMGQPQLQPLLRPSPEEIHGAAPGFAYGLSFSVWRSSRIRSLARWLLASIPLRGNCKSILNAQPVPRKGVQLERQLGSQLHGAVASNGVGYIAEGAGCIGGKALAGLIELRRIGDAEGFGAKLYVHALSNRKAAKYRGIQIEEARSAEGSAGHITQNADCSLAKWPSALPAIARRHIEPGLSRTDAVQYLERADQVRRLRIPWRVQN